MTIIKLTEGARSIRQMGKIGDYAEYGRVWYGHAQYGLSFEDAGIYQMRTLKMGEPEDGTVYQYKKRPIKMKFYNPPESRTEEQATQRDKMVAAVAAYQALTPAERLVYHTRAVGKRYTGYNLFLRESMLS